MSDKIFIDTNVLVYCYSNDEPEKRNLAQNLVSSSNSIVSTQVFTEMANTLSRKFKLPWLDIGLVLEETALNFKIHINLPETISKASTIANKYGFSFYDSLIISAALEEKCSILFSEDMHNGLVIEEKLSIINPFKKDK